MFTLREEDTKKGLVGNRKEEEGKMRLKELEERLIGVKLKRGYLVERENRKVAKYYVDFKLFWNRQEEDYDRWGDYDEEIEDHMRLYWLEFGPKVEDRKEVK